MQVADEIWDLIVQGHLVEAIELGETESTRAGGDAWEVAGNLAQAYLALGRYSDAYNCYALRDRIDQTARPGLRHLHPMAQVAWLLGKETKALAHAREDIELLASGDTTMADAAGGVSNALFLHYCGSKLGDDAAKGLALKFVEHLAGRSRRFQNWPGPIGAFYLGRISFEDVLFFASKQRNLAAALSAASQEKLMRRELIQALFYVGAKKRDLSDDASCLALMEAASALHNPFAELEWHLARKEVEDTRAKRAPS